ncbi:MAG: phage replisome organizer N-terminal domain-containing protein, partial [Armatimonadota bacterium]
MNWLRLHDDFINDPKMRRYFSKEERYVWIALLCMANKGKVRGVVSHSDDEIAYALEMEDDEWLTLAAKFQQRGMIDRTESGDVHISNWSARQYEKPSDTPEETRIRKQNQRDRERDAKQTPPPHNSVTQGHAGSRAIIASHATEAETE